MASLVITGGTANATYTPNSGFTSYSGGFVYSDATSIKNASATFGVILEDSLSGGQLTSEVTFVADTSGAPIFGPCFETSALTGFAAVLMPATDQFSVVIMTAGVDGTVLASGSISSFITLTTSSTYTVSVDFDAGTNAIVFKIDSTTLATTSYTGGVSGLHGGVHGYNNTNNKITALDVSASGGSTYTLTANAGAYTYSGGAATILKSKVVSANAGSYSYNGKIALIQYASASSLLRKKTFGLYYPKGRRASRIGAGIFYSKSPNDAGATVNNDWYFGDPVAGGYTLTADAGSYALTGVSATIAKTRIVSAAAGSYAYTGIAATLARSKLVTASAGSYTYTGQAATISYTAGYTLTASAGSYSYTGQSATILKSKILSASAGSYVYTGVSASLIRNKLLVGDSGAYTYTGKDAVISYAPSGSYVLNANAGSYSLTGKSASINVSTNGRSKLYNSNLIDHPAWAWNEKKAEVKQESVIPEQVEIVQVLEPEITDYVDNSAPIEPIIEEIKALESQLSALNIHVEKMQSYDKLFKLEQELRIEQKRLDDEEMAIILCIAELL